MQTRTFRCDHRVQVKNPFRTEDWRDMSADVVSVDTSRAYGAPAGSFHVSLVPRVQGLEGSWDQIVNPGDMIRINLDGGAGDGLTPIILGIVSRVARSMFMQASGQPEQRVTIIGQDMGKLLVKHQVGWDTAPTEDHIGSEEVVMHGIAPQAYQGTPAKMVAKLMEALFYREKLLEWTEPFIITEATATTAPDNWEKYDMAVLTRSGSMWTVLQSVANAPWNTLTGDTLDDGKFHLLLEQTPFHEETGRVVRGTTKTNQVEDIDLINYTLGRDDAERVNYLFLQGNILSFGDNNDFPLYFMKEGMVRKDEESIQHHGFHPAYPSTTFSPPTYLKGQNADEKEELKQLVGRRAGKLWNWYKGNHLRTSGTMTIKGTPSIRAGNLLRVPSLELEFLADSVAHQYRWGAGYRTVVNVSRGMRALR